METTFVNKKSELSTAKATFENSGNEVFRTRMHCNCNTEFNRRFGILVVNNHQHLIAKVIRCKQCAKVKEA